MQLRKRTHVVNYTENGSPKSTRIRRSDSVSQGDVLNSDSDGESETSDDSLEEEAFERLNSDHADKMRPSKKAGRASGGRKHSAGRETSSRQSSVLMFKKRNAENAGHSSSPSSEDEDDVDDDFVKVAQKRKKSRTNVEPRARSLRARKVESVNYKDASSSDDEGASKDGVANEALGGDVRIRKFKPRDRSSSEPHSDNEDDDAEDVSKLAKHSTSQAEGSSVRKLQRLASTLSSGDICGGRDGVVDPESMKCDSRRMEGEDGDDGSDAGPVGDGVSGRRPIRISSESEDDIARSGSDDEFQASDAQGTKGGGGKEGTAVSGPLFSLYKVDTYGLLDDNGDYMPITKRIGRNKVEKILAVKGRTAGAPVYCVKFHGKSYRHVVNVPEAQLFKHCTQLLRTFLRRLDQLGRKEGNLADFANAPAFSPQHLKIDRIVARDKQGRWVRYFVKWRGMAYSESTWERGEDMTDDCDAIKRFKAFNRRVKPNTSKGSAFQLSFNDGRSLRDYQEEGVSWLQDKFQNGVNCILADEMGLGKTIQSVAMLETLRIKHGIHGPFLVVAPVSTLGHWQREVESLTNMNCVVYSGNQEDREIIRDYEFKYDDDKKSSAYKFNIMLTSFEILMKDQSKLTKIDWEYLIVDEAHRLKSRGSKTTISLKQMEVARGGLLLLTGTPVQNSTKEIFSLLNLLDSENFDSEEEFLLKYGDLRNAEQVKDLQDNVLRPRLLRRMKEDVEKSIPLKEETIVWVELTSQQWIYYRAIFEKNIATLLKGNQSNNAPNLRNVAMELRKVCNHPLLCDGVEEDLTMKFGGKKAGQGSAIGGEDSNLALKLLQQSSGKMVFLNKLLPMLKDAGNRVLIFSQFTMMLDLLEDYLNHKNYSYERIDGAVKGSDRQAAIDRFSAKESEIFVFLLSTKAGGLGITLTAADTCLIYDSDWNPQNDLQAMARCHRIGQTKDVRIYRLITSKTYEQKLFEVSSRKYGLDEAILGNRVGADVDLEQTVNIESLLKRGAYDMLKDDDGSASEKFSTQNIHEILADRTQKRLIGGRGVNTFSVATFISQPEADAEPDNGAKPKEEKGAEQFWEELLPEAVQASKAAKERKPILTTSDSKRRRTRVDYREDPKAVSDNEPEEESCSKDTNMEESSSSDDSDSDEVSWPEREVKRLEDKLISLGRDRASQIQEEASLGHRSLAQVEQVCEYIIQFCQYSETVKLGQTNPIANQINSSVKAPEVSNGTPRPIDAFKPTEIGDSVISPIPTSPEGQQELLPAGCALVNDHETGVNYRKAGLILIGDTRRPTPPNCIRVAVKNRTLLDRLAKNSSRYLQQLREREILAHAIAENDPRYLPPKLPVRSKKIPSWWGLQEDNDLLVGLHKHGHREFRKVRLDPTLCFAKRITSANVSTGSTYPPVRDCAQNESASPPYFPGISLQANPQCALNSSHFLPSSSTSVPQAPSSTGSADTLDFVSTNASGVIPSNTATMVATAGGHVMIPPVNTGAAWTSGSYMGAASAVEDEWPQDMVLGARLKKLIQMLPRVPGLCDVTKRIPIVDQKPTIDPRITLLKSEFLAARNARQAGSPSPRSEKTNPVGKASGASMIDSLQKDKKPLVGAKGTQSTSQPPSTSTDRKETSSDVNGTQQKITGFFIPKVVVAS